MKKTILLLSCLTLVLMQACGSKPEPEPTPSTPDPVLSVSPASLSFNQDGGSQTVQVTANNAWTTSASGSGITVSPASGQGNASVTVTVAATSSADDTNGTVTFKSKSLSATVDVTQSAKPVITVGTVSTIPAEGGTFTVDIQYNTDFTVEVESSASSWLYYNATRALTSGKLSFTFAANTAYSPRTGKATVKDKAGKVDPIVLTFQQEKRSKLGAAREIMEKVYEAWGARKWTKQPWTAGQWPGFYFDENTETVQLSFNDFGINREMPDCIGDFGVMLTSIVIRNEPALKGTLPDSFRKLTALERITIQETGMTSLADVFGNMEKLAHFEVNINGSMTGSLPKSLRSPVLTVLQLGHNMFTGSIPDSSSRDCQVRTTENSIPPISYTRVAAEARLPSSNSEKSCLSAERI